MTELVRWDPLRPGIGPSEVGRWSSFADDFLGLVPSLFAPLRRFRDEALRMDIGETDVAYEMAVELPGVGRDAIDLSIEENSVTISAQVPEPQDDKTSWLLRERSSGRMRRTITLPEPVDQASSEAKYVDGVLYITLKKQRASQAKRLTIH
ncbi:MAG TPA: Hsp20/alpha crystallin family protein [Burkholderiales bacterium]|nr:Hsp20/alpha crystallin family protein [Burkholderiales bacterium]